MTTIVLQVSLFSFPRPPSFSSPRLCALPPFFLARLRSHILLSSLSLPPSSSILLASLYCGIPWFCIFYPPAFDFLAQLTPPENLDCEGGYVQGAKWITNDSCTQCTCANGTIFCDIVETCKRGEGLEEKLLFIYGVPWVVGQSLL